MSDELKRSLEDAEVVMFGNYCYMIHPLLDGFPQINPKLLEQTTDRMVEVLQSFDECDFVVTIEAMGIHLASAVCLKLKKPLLIIRKRRYGREDEVELNKKTGYQQSSLYINGLKKNSRVVLIDDVISTGGTMSAVLRGLRELDVEVVGVVAVVDKSGLSFKLQEEFDIPVVALEYVKVLKEGVRVISKEESKNG